jgi:cytosine deaminase
MILYNVKLPFEDEERLFTIEVEDGRYTRIEKQDELQHTGLLPLFELKKMTDLEGDIDAQGCVLFPSFVDIHTHMDKAFSLRSVPNQSGTLVEAIQNYSLNVQHFNKEEIQSRVMKMAVQSLMYGTTHIRTHVNFEMDRSWKLALGHLEAVLAAKRRLAPFLSIQVVPMFSNLSTRDAAEWEIINEAVEMGADGIGGAPHLSPRAKEDIETLFSLAEKYNLFLDLHVDENDDPNIDTIIDIINTKKSRGFEGQITAGHLCSLAAMQKEKAVEIIRAIKSEKINVVTLPGANMYLQGRLDQGLIRRGVTRVKELIGVGANVAAASDNVNDPFHPFGRGDLLLVGLLTSYASQLNGKEDLQNILRMVTEIPGSMFGIKHGVKVGNEAHFVILYASDNYELFASLPDGRAVYTNKKWQSLKTSSWATNDCSLKEWM